jgi:hypothetical protein
MLLQTTQRCRSDTVTNPTKAPIPQRPQVCPVYDPTTLPLEIENNGRQHGPLLYYRITTFSSKPEPAWIPTPWFFDNRPFLLNGQKTRNKKSLLLILLERIFVVTECSSYKARQTLLSRSNLESTDDMFTRTFKSRFRTGQLVTLSSPSKTELFRV